MKNLKTGVTIFQLFLQKVISADIPLVLLRPREISEEISYSGDYDFFVHPHYNHELLKIMFELGVETGTSFSISRKKHAKVDINIYDKEDNKVIALEIWNFLSVDDPYGRTQRYIFPNILQQHIQKDKNSFRLSLEIEALYYLSHLYTGKKKITTPLVQERIKYYTLMLQENHDEYYLLFKDLQEQREDIKKVAHKANIILCSKGILKEKNLLNMLEEFPLKYWATVDRTRRMLFKKVRIIPVEGADGVGKTTIVQKIIDEDKKHFSSFRFKKTFRSSPLYRLFLPLLKRRVTKVVPEVEIGKTEIDEVYGEFVLFNALLLFPFRFVSSFFSKKTVFVDRYFDEYLIINLRLKQRKAYLRKNWQSLLKFIPRTYMIFHFDAPTEKILKRKDELNKEGIEAYRNYLFEIYLQKPYRVYTYVNTDTEVEKSVDLMLKIIKGEV
ncbi:hypothetical protein [Sulfurimonas paralvinellae]|uniref:Thymidylate kinase-like domain-containing protein n=1 Tax=Sulfurimonas paralvinellae TaxID=317658 RepID=A0A7M1B901_9BACT|nr:hypothetical protein [Sulfurimonas paralvinellae]QOP46111.1 hypothetical protein FM071_07340 [Sulfurimonas paralvinellae]